MNPTARIAPASLASLGAVTTIVLSGCASSLSGVGGTQSYACKAPTGAQCTSVSGVYANANPFITRSLPEALPPQSFLTKTRQAMPNPPTPAPVTPAPDASAVATAPTPAALRSPARVMRLWIAPWEDADGDLHAASFVHVVVDTGRWLIDRVRPAARPKLDIATPPLSPPLPPPPSPPSPSVSPPEKGSPVELSPIEP